MRPNMSMQTCAVSSVGKRGGFINRGTYDFDVEIKDSVADNRVIYVTVRPRDDESLVGVERSEQGFVAQC
jgi:hypothetical protein